jgi:hypothetical protein
MNIKLRLHNKDQVCYLVRYYIILYNIKEYVTSIILLIDYMTYFII